MAARMVTAMAAEASWRITGGSQHYEPPGERVRERRLRAVDRPGEHLWVITGAWLLADPERPFRETTILDMENMLGLSGPGCYKCEKPWSRRLARQPCTGSVDEIQP